MYNNDYKDTFKMFRVNNYYRRFNKLRKLLNVVACYYLIWLI